MKKIVALLLALVSVMLCSTSCTPIPDVPSTAEESNFTASSISLVYRNLYFSKEKAGDDLKYDQTSYTLKYHNIDNVQEESIPVYNDVFAGNEDPFITNGPSARFMLDKKATEENGGIPVLIYAHKYEIIGDNTLARIFSFNTATNKMTLIADNITNFCDNFWLYNDTIFYYCYNPAFDDGGDGFEPYSVSKYGGDVTRYEFPDRSFHYKLIEVYKDKLYFANSKTLQLYRSDLDFKNAELLNESLRSPIIKGGYLYYIVPQTTEIDGCTIGYSDLYRSPLDDLNFEKSEIVLEKATKIEINENKVYHGLVDDLELVPLPAYLGGTPEAVTQIRYSYDLITGEKSTVYDYSNDKRLRITVLFTNEDYYRYTYRVPTDEIVMGEAVTKTVEAVVNRNTGKETIVPEENSIS